MVIVKPFWTIRFWTSVLTSKYLATVCMPNLGHPPVNSISPLTVSLPFLLLDHLSKLIAKKANHI